MTILQRRLLPLQSVSFDCIFLRRIAPFLAGRRSQNGSLPDCCFGPNSRFGRLSGHVNTSDRRRVTSLPTTSARAKGSSTWMASRRREYGRPAVGIKSIRSG